MKARLCSVLFPLALSIVGPSLSLPVPAFAAFQLYTVDLQTISDSSGSLAKGTVQCDAGHVVLAIGNVFQLVQGKIVQAAFTAFVNCTGVIQDWAAPLLNQVGVPKPGRGAVVSFGFDLTDFTYSMPLGTTLNQMIIIKGNSP